jgi:hypothetical protein
MSDEAKQGSGSGSGSGGGDTTNNNNNNKTNSADQKKKNFVSDEGSDPKQNQNTSKVTTWVVKLVILCVYCDFVLFR